MTRLDNACYWLSLLTVLLLVHGQRNAIAYERPAHLAVTALATCAFLIVAVSKALPNLFSPANSRPIYTPISQIELPSHTTPTAPSVVPTSSPSPTNLYPNRVRITVLLVAIAALATRVECYRQIATVPECTTTSLTVFLPVLLAIYDAYRFQKNEKIDLNEKPDSNIYDSIILKIKIYITQPRTRYILPVVASSYACMLYLSLWAPLNSTHICPIVTGQQSRIPRFQFLALVLDFILSIIIYENLPRRDGSGLSPRRNVILWTSTAAGAVFVWAIVAIIFFRLQPESRRWLTLLTFPDLASLVLSIFWQSFLFSFCCILVLHSVLAFGIFQITTAVMTVATVFPSIIFIWTERNLFPQTSASVVLFGFVFLYSGWWSLQKTRASLKLQEKVSSSRARWIFFCGLIAISPSWIKTSSMSFHPIDLLIYDGGVQHELYLNATAHNNSLVESVIKYQQKYGRNPPPGFDVWWEYATNRSCRIVDEYDQIFDDLLPFFSVAPSDLRRQTWEMVSNPWNEISGITIRDGVASVQENVLPTHRWMLEGVAILINAFAVHLPDMDLAFNLNDESRVAVPFEELTKLREAGQKSVMDGSKSWSSNRKDGWLPIPEENYHETIFKDNSFRNSFSTFGAVGCSPNSAAINDRYSVQQSTLCTACTAPHSLGQFVSNWTAAADVCHQPDLSHLHGFYLSPAAFKGSYQLMPVFSQSKVHGYNDILYPSAWNYMDKVIYAPSQEQVGNPGEDGYRPAFPDYDYKSKANVLFWRGATSEGVSSGDHAWRGMARQRLVHLANNLTSHNQDQAQILLPNSNAAETFSYKSIPGDLVHNLGMSTDIRIVDHIARCGGVGFYDCTDQESEFAPIYVRPSDFQDHWKYRYLFDLDGAAFSGRFLPFLQSHSLPFKSALFREWYDSRLTAWCHFVPQDIRMHGLYSTLAYFAGIDGRLPNGKILQWPGHTSEGEMIAEAGRDWANQVLRKPDMEVYFFRLLLEWARLTDDNRDQLGFVI